MLINIEPATLTSGRTAELLTELCAVAAMISRYKDGYEVNYRLRWGSRARVVSCSFRRRVYRQTTDGSRIVLTREECRALRDGADAIIAATAADFALWCAPIDAELRALHGEP